MQSCKFIIIALIRPSLEIPFVYLEGIVSNIMIYTQACETYSINYWYLIMFTRALIN